MEASAHPEGRRLVHNRVKGKIELCLNASRGEVAVPSPRLKPQALQRADGPFGALLEHAGPELAVCGDNGLQKVRKKPIKLVRLKKRNKIELLEARKLKLQFDWPEGTTKQ